MLSFGKLRIIDDLFTMQRNLLISGGRHMIDFILKRDGRQIPFEQEKNLKVIIPICSCCHKIHVGKKSWQQQEIHLSKYSEAALSHGLCPDCYEEQRIEFMKFKSRPTVYQPQTA